MIPLVLAGKGVAALSVFKRHWGKIISALFVLAWIWATLGLYNSNQDLTLALGAANSAVSVCIADRNNMDNELILLKADIALIQADNVIYKEGIAEATIIIKDLTESIDSTIIEIDREVIPDSCEGAMDWMLEKALEK